MSNEVRARTQGCLQARLNLNQPQALHPAQLAPRPLTRRSVSSRWKAQSQGPLLTAGQPPSCRTRVCKREHTDDEMRGRLRQAALGLQGLVLKLRL